MSMTLARFDWLKRIASRRAKQERIAANLMRDMVARENGYADWPTLARLVESPIRELAANEGPGT